MNANCPKQFLSLAGMPVVEHSLDLFASMPEVSQIVLVSDFQYRERFARHIDLLGSRLTFAMPGKERQNSVYYGLMMVREGASLACIHDSARPLVTEQSVRRVLQDANEYGAAVLGVPSKATIKESEDGQFVLRTIPRNRLWEIQTPQVIKPELLKEGFEKVMEEGLEVTDDVSIIEQLGKPVRITLGEYTNIKLTTPEDLDIAELILKNRGKDATQDCVKGKARDGATDLEEVLEGSTEDIAESTAEDVVESTLEDVAESTAEEFAQETTKDTSSV